MRSLIMGSNGKLFWGILLGILLPIIGIFSFFPRTGVEGKSPVIDNNGVYQKGSEIGIGIVVEAAQRTYNNQDGFHWGFVVMFKGERVHCFTTGTDSVPYVNNLVTVHKLFRGGTLITNAFACRVPFDG